MHYRTLGRTDLSVSEIGFGAWAIGGGWGPQTESESIEALHKAFDLGVNFIDTAAGYGDGRSERIIGKVLKERRETIYVATKTQPAPGPWPPSPYCRADERYAENYLRQNIEERLRNLGTDCIDLLQLHTWTRAWNREPIPLKTLQKLRDEGKIRYIGLSTPEHDQNSVIELMRAGYLDAVQVIYNIFEQEPAAELLPVAAEYNVGIIVRVAFDEGVLTGKYEVDSQFPADEAVERVEKIKKDIAGSGLNMPQVALKFALAPSAVSTVIPGIRNVWQVEANVGVSDLPDLADDLIQKLRNHAWNRAFWYGGK
jgi:aryl-alcohol dehydrogenase-like predicted oxidoreductase